MGPSLVRLPRDSSMDDAAEGPTLDLTLLRRIPLLAMLDIPTLQALVPLLRVVEVDAGEVVVREGEPSDRLFFLVSGEVQVVKNWLLPGACAVDVLRPYAFFGEMGLVLDDVPRSATVVSTEPSRFVTLARAPFRRFLLTNADAAWALLVEAHRRLRQMNTLLSELG